MDAIQHLVTDLLFTGSILLAVYSQIHLPRAIRFTYITLGIVAIASNWIVHFSHHSELIPTILFVLFFGMSMTVYAHSLFIRRTVDVDTILAAACAYILIGFFFACLYALILYLDASAFSYLVKSENTIYDLLYFSFVTLTTLGYGDIFPTSNLTKMVAAYQAIIGQIFITIVVAELVGIHVANRLNQRQANES